MAFSDARTNAQQPQVSVPRNQAGPDTTSSNVISAFGEVGGQIRQGQVEGNLEKSLAESGNIIATLNDPNTVTQEQDDGSVLIDVSLSDPTGSIDRTSDRFNRIAAGVNQGKISEESGAIEAEVVLRQSIARAPGFATQLRKLAQDVLGFNPSGAALNALFLSGPDTNVLSQEDKDNAEALTRFQQGFFSSVASAKQSVVGERARAGQRAETNYQIQQAQLGVPRLVASAGKATQENMNAIMLRGIQQVRTTGGIADIEELRGGLMTGANLAIAEMTQSMGANEGNYYGAAEFGLVRDEIIRVRDANIGLLENQDILTVFTRRQDLLQKVMSIEAFNLAPELMLMSQFGPKAVEDYLELMAASHGDPQQMAEFMKINPAFAFVGDLGVKAQQIGPALRAITDGTLASGVQNGTIDGDLATGVLKFGALQQIEGIGNPTELDAVLTSLSDLELPNMVLSTAAQTKNSYNNTKPATRARIASEFQQAQELVKSDIANNLTGTEWALILDNKSGKFAIQRRDGAGLRKFDKVGAEGKFNPSQFSSLSDFQVVKQDGTSTAPEVKEQLALLNSTLLPMAKDPRWANEFGIVDPTNWVNEVTQEVNSFAIESELAAPGELGGLGKATITQQVRIRQAMETGNNAEVFKVLEEMGLPAFNQQATNVGRPLERANDGDMFVDLETGNVIRLNNEGKTIENIAGSGAIDRGPFKLNVEPIKVRDDGRFTELNKTLGDLPGPKVPKKHAATANAIQEGARERGLDPRLVLAIAQVESGFDPDAANSNSTALGLFQAIDANFEQFGPKDGDRTTPSDSIEAALNFLEHLDAKFEGQVSEIILRWHDGQNSSGPGSDAGIDFLEKVTRALNGLPPKKPSE